MDIEDLPTPSLILDRAVVTRNTQRMAARMAEHGVALRPASWTDHEIDQPAAFVAPDLSYERTFAALGATWTF
jgi:hypothetical protein